MKFSISVSLMAIYSVATWLCKRASRRSYINCICIQPKLCKRALEFQQFDNKYPVLLQKRQHNIMRTRDSYELLYGD
ncbi:hypothetical protein M758_3G116500 [Ceratodon purpureus]|uniref:Secreted protein n=1 Tax=Ceratodon purpureus TaxID=3225 RepID=A0A8T0IK17_CERPU|nr:hypothetical protein KC19_3G115200 [Ceratodon purpureus]KAG0622692.1 hypothetical protein M758_3G116500 [Ceratodon purpureus]